MTQAVTWDLCISYLSHIAFIFWRKMSTEVCHCALHLNRRIAGYLCFLEGHIKQTFCQNMIWSWSIYEVWTVVLVEKGGRMWVPGLSACMMVSLRTLRKGCSLRCQHGSHEVVSCQVQGQFLYIVFKGPTGLWSTCQLVHFNDRCGTWNGKGSYLISVYKPRRSESYTNMNYVVEMGNIQNVVCVLTHGQQMRF